MATNRLNNKNGDSRKELEELLPIVYSRTFNASIRDINRFTLKNLKNVPITKSKVFSLSGIDGKVENGYVPMIPMVIAVKKYQETVERTSERYPRSTKDEYQMESTILSLGHILKHERGSETYLVYPQYYSPHIEECDKKLYIFREFIPGETLAQVALKTLNSVKPNEIDWENVSQPLKNPLYPISLLHIKGPKLEEAFPSGLQLPYFTLGNLVEGFSHYLWRILDKKQKLKRVKREIKRASESMFKILAPNPREKDYLKNISVINGDLDVYTGHIIMTENKSRLLDAGSTEKSAFFRDLAVYGDPVFSPVRDIERAVSKEYIEIRNKLEDELHLDKTEFNLDELTLGFCVSAFRGNIRRAASLIHYKRDQVKNTNIFNKQVAAHLSRASYFLDKVQDIASGDIKKGAKKMKENLKRLEVFNEYQDYMEKEIPKIEEERGLGIEIKKDETTESLSIRPIESTRPSVKRILLKPSEIINPSEIIKYMGRIFGFGDYCHHSSH